MKAAFVAAAALVGVGAGHLHQRQAHQDLFKPKRSAPPADDCTCTTVYTTITGTPGLYTPPPAPSSSSAPVSVPTPIAQTCETPGTYTFPATTVVVSETTTVCGASSTQLPKGTHTLGGVTTTVPAPTTVVFPYPTTKTVGTAVTSLLQTTTYVCPSAGVYTVAPVETVVTVDVTQVVVPVVTSYAPGTYTAPAVVTTVTDTSVVVYCPFETPTPTPTPAPAPTSASPPPPPPPPPKTSSSSSSPPPPPPPPKSSSSSSSSSSAPSSSPPPQSSSPPLGGGDRWAITYTPYAANGQCKGASEVKADVAKIKQAGFTTVRVYSTDCDTLPNVGGACKEHGLKIILGIFIGEVGCDNGSPDVAEQITAIKQWAQWELVELLVVGNEAMFNNYCTPSQLTDLIHKVKGTLGAAGYSGPTTTTDVVSSWLKLGAHEVCGAIDVVGTNAHAYFNGAILPGAAGLFVASQLKLVEGVCGKSGYVLESGWPSGGKCIGTACPGRQQQATAIKSIQKTIGDKVVFFSFGNDEWKEPGDCQCERFWGCGDLFGA